MSIEPQTFRDVIALWPTVGALAADIDVRELNARQWKLRNSIPGEYWARIATEAAKRAESGEEKFANVTLDLLAHLGANAGQVAA